VQPTKLALLGRGRFLAAFEATVHEDLLATGGHQSLNSLKQHTGLVSSGASSSVALGEPGGEEGTVFSDPDAGGAIASLAGE